ncbi:MAG: tRNA (adenosine(37)-N6)-dimethylallyltransferase MiaA [Omnitrophica WOR_2 bacterium RBG_13_41_10]|nr:MAG: tRNA (adenosine(37)-N6)-dimethylallyltransferase MiaA [Omnitrophica WOR_2 bacterium RBG_13_41_10]
MLSRKSQVRRRKPKIIFLVGPTAVGKSQSAVYLAKKINAEIISCDSMQIYKGMDIITSKPSIILRKTIPHHFISMVSPIKGYNVAQYRRGALKKIQEILEKGKTPLFVGGTGLYMSVLIDGIFQAKSENKNIRRRLYKELDNLGKEYLYKRLQKLDPEAAAKIHPHDSRRIIRALEVQEATGKPISVLQKERNGIADNYDVRIFCLDTSRQRLYKRIDQRVEEMFKKGLLGEVKKLLKMKLSKTAQAAIGIKELKGYLSGLYDLGEAKSLMKRNTRLYAKRQLTWFRKDKRIEWIEIKGKEKPVSIVNKILALYSVHGTRY